MLQWGFSGGMTETIGGAALDDEGSLEDATSPGFQRHSDGAESMRSIGEEQLLQPSHQASRSAYRVEYADVSEYGHDVYSSPERVRRLLQNLCVHIAQQQSVLPSEHDAGITHRGTSVPGMVNALSPFFSKCGHDDAASYDSPSGAGSNHSTSGVNLEKLILELHDGFSTLCVLTDESFDMLISEASNSEHSASSLSSEFNATHGQASSLPLGGSRSLDFPSLPQLNAQPLPALQERSCASLDAQRRGRPLSIDVPYGSPNPSPVSRNSMQSPASSASRKKKSTSDRACVQPSRTCIPALLRPSRKLRQEPVVETEDKVTTESNMAFSTARTPMDSRAATSSGSRLASDAICANDGRLSSDGVTKHPLITAAVHHERNEQLQRTVTMLQSRTNVAPVKRRIAYAEVEIRSNGNLLLEHVRVRIVPPSPSGENSGITSPVPGLDAQSPRYSEYKSALGTMPTPGAFSMLQKSNTIRGEPQQSHQHQQHQQPQQSQQHAGGRHSRIASTTSPSFTVYLPTSISSHGSQRASRHASERGSFTQHDDDESEGGWIEEEEEVNRLMQGKIRRDESVINGIHRIVFQQLNVSPHHVTVDPSTIRRLPADNECSYEFPTLVTEHVKYQAKVDLSMPELDPKHGLRFSTREDQRRSPNSRPAILEHHWIWCEERLWEFIKRRTYSLNGGVARHYSGQHASTCFLGKLPHEEAHVGRIDQVTTSAASDSEKGHQDKPGNSLLQTTGASLLPSALQSSAGSPQTSFKVGER